MFHPLFAEVFELSPIPIAFIMAAVMFLFVLFVLLVGYFAYFRNWIRAYKAQLNLSLLNIVAMSVQKVSASKVIDALVAAKEAGFLADDTTLTSRNVAVHEMQGGSANRVVHEMREQRRLNKSILSFEELAKLELESQPPFDRSVPD